MPTVKSVIKIKNNNNQYNILFLLNNNIIVSSLKTNQLISEVFSARNITAWVLGRITRILNPQLDKQKFQKFSPVLLREKEN